MRILTIQCCYLVFQTNDGSSFQITDRGFLSFISAPDYEQKSEYEINIAVTDGQQSTSQKITISILDVNEAPVFLDEWRDVNDQLISGPEFEVFENHNMSGNFGQFTPSDPDGDEMTFSVDGDEIYVAGYDRLYFYSSPDYEEKFYSAILTLFGGELSTSQEITVTIKIGRYATHLYLKCDIQCC